MFDRYPRILTLDTGTSVVVRTLGSDDTEKLVRLFRDVQEDDALVMREDVTNPDVVRAWVGKMDGEQELSVVAELSGEILGQMSLHRRLRSSQPNVAQLRLYVRDDVRQAGLGWHLLDEALEVSRALGIEQVVMELFVDNAPLISAFERRGFKREAILPVYQLVVMRYDLAAEADNKKATIAHADRLPPQQDWPDFLFDHDLFEIPSQINLTSLLLDSVVEAGWGNRPAILYRNEVVTYDLLLGEVKRLASSLARLGVKAGDPVILHLPNTPQAIAANFAVQRLGALSVPTVAQFSNRELDHVAAESGAVAAITTAELADDMRRSREVAEKLGPIVVQGLRDHAPDDQLYSYARLVGGGAKEFPATPRPRDEIGLLLYTSADSGRPRGTAHRLDSLLAVLDAFGGHAWRVNEEDVIGSLAPLGFAQGFIVFGLLPFRFAASVALPSDPMADSGAALVDAIRRHHVTLLSAPPTTYREMLAVDDLDPLALASLRLCSSGGEPLTLETFQAWEERFEQPIFEGFGTTEMLYAFLSNAVGMQPRPGALGRIVPGYTVRVVSDTGNELGVGEIGLLSVRGPSGTLYWNNPAAQRRVVHSGWNQMHDYCYQDEDGYFWFVARSDDLIKSRSYRIDPNEVEAAIRDHPAVREVAVIGLPDAMRGQRPIAYVIPAEGEEAGPTLGRAIIESLDERLADYKIPDEVLFTNELPRNARGQLLRRVLRDQVRRRGEG